MIKHSFSMSERNQTPRRDSALYSPASSLELSPRCREPSMGKLHSNYGSTNNNDSFRTQYEDAQQFSLSSINTSEGDKFMSPCTVKSPWGVSLKKTSSSTPGRRDVKNICWTDPNSNMLLADFATPTASPWKKRMERAKKNAQSQLSPPPLTMTISQSPEGNNSTASTPQQAVATPDLFSSKKAKSATSSPSSTPVKITGILSAPDLEQVRKTPVSKSSITMTPSSRTVKIITPPSSSDEGGSPPTIRIAKTEKIKKTRHSPRRRSKKNDNKKELAQISALEERLRAIRTQTREDVDKIRAETAQEKKELRALTRAAKSASGEDMKKALDKKLKKNRATIADLKNQNAVIRKQNQKLFNDISSLRINNERLLSSQAESASCYAQLNYHNDMCVGENAKLNKVVVKYQETIAQHQEHLDLCNSYADVEMKMRMLYETTMDKTSNMLDETGDAELATDVHTMIEAMQ